MRFTSSSRWVEEWPGCREDDTIACDGVDGEGEQRRKTRSKLQMRALDSKLASALVMQSPFLESPAGTKGCWLAPKASLAPERVQFLAPRWSLKRLPARAAARGLPKRRAGHLGTVAPSCHTAILHLGGFISGYRLFLTTTQATFCGVDQSPAHSSLQTASGPRPPGCRHNTSTPPHCRQLVFRHRYHLDACPRPNLRIL